jgi:hypothetical protein
MFTTSSSTSMHIINHYDVFSCSQQTRILQHREENWSRWVESVVQSHKILHVNEQKDSSVMIFSRGEWKDSCVMIFSRGEWRFRGWLISFNSSSCHLFMIPWRCWKAVFHSYSLSSTLPSCQLEAQVGMLQNWSKSSTCTSQQVHCTNKHDYMLQDCKERSNPDFCGSGLSQVRWWLLDQKKLHCYLSTRTVFFWQEWNKHLKERSLLLIHGDNSFDI